MTKHTYMPRTGLTAIAAVLALSSTPLLAQEAEPVTDTSVTTTASTPEPTAEPVSTETTTTTASDPLAPAEAAPAATATTRTTASTRTPARSTARATTRPAPATSVSRNAPAAAPVAAPTPAAEAAPVEPLPTDLAAAPMTPEVAPPPVATDTTAIDSDDMLPIAGAAGLGILALAGAGMAMRRRRKNAALANDEFTHDEWVEPVAEPRIARPASTPVSTPAFSTRPADRSAFAWGKDVATAAPVAAAPMASARRDESHVDAAYRGPTPDNPFLSLKKRLRRAAFFDQRERAVRAGKAKPISLAAGLPKALAERVRPANGQRSMTPQFA